jgi:uroporphyrinogen decarboxylase
MEKDFSMQADWALKYHAVATRAILDGGLPRLLRLDHDMTDSRGTLADIRSFERIWFPHLSRAIQPFHEAGIRLIWHCDGNIMPMIPRLLEVGIRGFQGFQYEDGVDYERICKMTDRDGEPLLICGGVSVTRTLPLGTKEDVVREMKWLVEHGPACGLFLAGSSSIVPNTNRKNIRTMLEGLTYYRKYGRN